MRPLDLMAIALVCCYGCAPVQMNPQVATGDKSRQSQFNINAVNAENVILAGNNSSLTSENLQQALNHEIAPDLNKILPGTTWTVINKKGADSTFENIDGRVTFNKNGSITFTGSIAAFGVTTEPGPQVGGGFFSPCYPTTTVVTYEAVSSGAIYVLRQEIDPSQPSTNITATKNTASVVTLISAKKGELVLAGQGGCGRQGTDRISTLTLVPEIGG